MYYDMCTEKYKFSEMFCEICTENNHFLICATKSALKKYVYEMFYEIFTDERYIFLNVLWNLHWKKRNFVKRIMKCVLKKCFCNDQFSNAR